MTAETIPEGTGARGRPGTGSPVTFWVVALTAAWFGLFVVAGALRYALGLGESFCLFRRMTGYACPTCGGSRATIALVRGQFLEAFARNPLVAIAIPGAIAIVVASLVSRKNLAFALLGSRRFGIALVGALIANWLYLLLTGA